jgi:hypothetical protein
LYRAMEMTFWLPEAEAALAQVAGHDHEQHQAASACSLWSKSVSQGRHQCGRAGLGGQATRLCCPQKRAWRTWGYVPTKGYSRGRRLPQILGPGSLLSNRRRASFAPPPGGGAPWAGVCPPTSWPLRAWRSTRQALYQCQRRFMGFITGSSLQGYDEHVRLDMHGSAREVYTPGARTTCGLRANRIGAAYLGTCPCCALT